MVDRGGCSLLSLTQTEHGITGFLIVAEPDNRGGTRSETMNVDGAADGNALTLHTKTFLDLGSATITGTLSGRVLTLSFPTSSGAVESNRFTRSLQKRFNVALVTWQEQLKTAYVERRRKEEVAAARERKADAARTSASELKASAVALASAGKNLHEIAEFAQQLSACEVALKAMQEFADRFDREIGKTDCMRLHDLLVYLHDQLTHLRDTRVQLEDHAKQRHGPRE